MEIHVAAMTVWNVISAEQNFEMVHVPYMAPKQLHVDESQIKAVLNGLGPHYAYNSSFIDIIQKRIPLASVHPEAALMSWLSASGHTDLIDTASSARQLPSSTVLIF